MSDTEPPVQPPYYVVVFTSQRTTVDAAEYAAMAEEMMALAAQQPGFLSVDSIADGDGRGITCSYWRTLADIEAWKANARHLVAQRSGRKTWYERYRFVIAKDERVDEFRRLQD